MGNTTTGYHDNVVLGKAQLTAADIGRICHEANRALCQLQGDNSQDPWEFAPQWQKESAINGVLAVWSGAVSKPEDSHNEWLAEKERTGWKYGPVKNPDAKEHPCFVPYEQLPAEQRVKDHLFFGIAQALLESVVPVGGQADGS